MPSNLKTPVKDNIIKNSLDKPIISGGANSYHHVKQPYSKLDFTEITLTGLLFPFILNI